MPFPGSAVRALALAPGKTCSLTAIIHLLPRMDISTPYRWLSSRYTHQQSKQQTDKQSDHKQYNRGCHSRSKVECGTRKHVVIRVRRHGLELAAGQYVEEIEHADGSEGAEEQRDDQRPPEHRQANSPELLPARAPIYTGRFIHFVGNDLK